MEQVHGNFKSKPDLCKNWVGCQLKNSTSHPNWTQTWHNTLPFHRKECREVDLLMPEPLRGIGPLSQIDLLEEIVFSWCSEISFQKLFTDIREASLSNLYFRSFFFFEWKNSYSDGLSLARSTYNWVQGQRNFFWIKELILYCSNKLWNYGLSKNFWLLAFCRGAAGIYCGDLLAGLLLQLENLEGFSKK